MRAFGTALVLLALGLPKTGYADALRVVADIAPVHSLVAQIMDGIGEPEVLLPAVASPHDYALRPSDARLLQEADAIFWVGDELTPWLGDTLATLSREAVNIQLLDTKGTLRLDFREGAVFAGAEEDHESYSQANDDDEHDEENGSDGSDLSNVDPHAWLDPSNAKVWLGSIAAELSKIDPANAERYQANLLAAQGRLDTITSALSKEMAAMPPIRFVVLHDGFRYFEDRFDQRAVGAIYEGDASESGAGRVSDILQVVESESISCLLTNVQFQSPLLEVLADETKASVVTIDAFGELLSPGKGLYGQMINDIAESFKACF